MNDYGYLVKGELKWADEIDNGYVVVTKNELESDRKVLETLVNEYPEYEQEVSCGSNGEVTVSPEDALAELRRAIPLSYKEYELFDCHDLLFVGRSCYNMFDIGDAKLYIKKKIEKAEHKKAQEIEKQKAIEIKKQKIEDLQNFFKE